MATSTGFAADLGTLLRRRGFRRLFAVRLAGQFGDGVLQAALASYVFFSPERQPTALAAAAAFAVLLLPYSLVGPFAGVFLDRWQRRQVLLIVNLLRAALTVVVAVQVFGDELGVPFFGTILVILALTRFVLAGLSASIPRVVHRDELVMANSVAPTSGAAVMLAGVGAGYLAQRWLLGTGADESAEGEIAVIAATIYASAGLLALRLKRTLLGPDEPIRIPVVRAVKQVAIGMAEGAAHIAARKPVRRAVAVLAATRFFYGFTLITAILLSRNYLNDPQDVDAGLDTFAMLLGVSGAGFLLAAVLTPLATRAMRKEIWASVLLASAGAVNLMPGMLFTVAAFVVVAAALGVATQGTKIVVDTVAHENIDDSYRGRVFSFYDVAFNASFVAAAAVAAITLPPTGHSYVALVAVAAGFGLTGLLYSIATTRGAVRWLRTPWSRASRVGQDQVQDSAVRKEASQ